MAVYEKKLKGIQRILTIVMDIFERFIAYQSIRNFISNFLRYLKMEQVTRYLDLERLNLG